MSGSLVLTVEFQVAAENAEAFARAISENAAASVREEPGCLQFDVIRDVSNPELFLLYEVYANQAAFDQHLEQAHTTKFLALAKSMVRSHSRRTFERVAAPAKAD